MDNLKMLQDCYRMKQLMQEDVGESEKALGGSSLENYKLIREKQLRRIKEIITLVNSL